jgi:hypothetical protein
VEASSGDQHSPGPYLPPPPPPGQRQGSPRLTLGLEGASLRRKRCGHVELGWEKTEEGCDVDRDGRYERHTANKPPRL